MDRKLHSQLVAWRSSNQRKPLIVHGARQVGKTYGVLDFGRAQYSNTVYLNLEENGDVARVFERDLNPERIVRELAALSGQTITQGGTLLFLDEVQACERALAALKYFCEDAPGYHVVVAGSLLGVAVNRESYSFPVGKVDMLTVRPMDFEEFLWALDRIELACLIRESHETSKPLSLHDTAMDLYRMYLLVGGMPRAVLDYAAERDPNFVLAAQRNINDAYIADMAKYATPTETVKIMAAYSSIPAQLAKENHKFQYRIIKSGARAQEYEVPLHWLRASGVIIQCTKVTEGRLPLAAYADPGSFKAYMADTGLLCSKLGIPASVVLSGAASFDGFKGALAENYVCGALAAVGYTPYYWESAGRAEVDFVIQDAQGNIVPVEVKSADNVRSRSLHAFIDRYSCPYGIRVSARNAGFEGNIRSVPLYAAFCI